MLPLVDLIERPGEVRRQTAERCLERGPAADQHIVSSTPHLRTRRQTHDFPEAAPDAIAHDGVADLPRHREPDPGRTGIVARTRL